MAVCLVKGTSATSGQQGGVGGQAGKPGLPGTVQFVHFDKPGEQMQVEDVGIAGITCKAGDVGRPGADGANGSAGQPGKDVAFIALSAKEIVELSAGKYELILEDSQADRNSIKSKLLGGKFLRIGSQISSPINFVKNGRFQADQGENANKVKLDVDSCILQALEKYNVPKAKHVLEIYGAYIKSEDFEMQLDEAEWWSKAIIELS